MTAAHATARRAQLFDQLVELLLAEGFAHLTLDDIASRLHCSKSTLYTLAGSKEQLVRAATVHFFRGATDQVEAAIAGIEGFADRLTAYLSAVGVALQPASDRFMDDLAAFAPAREIYEQNTAFAATRVQELIDDGASTGEVRSLHAAFVADVAASTMARIQSREVAQRTGLDDSQAYAELAALLTTGLTDAGS
ncbi:TetR/AcrR family transcriptional regulator [Rhodococcus sp. BP-252]|uniref:TetR family transcriptional regulator n=1 Tax=Rhodococcoides kyotonense TaxID=398843 RepID=A0A177YGM2_9NOCA|nr:MULTISPECIES: TetR/AcrR family transcriptional regulator [Rhodococcus]MBY6414157.1 TetR/AcrR family transcriptional regulator [Rhodococcus sp. BP-320]MBY6418979.1 TetR/AcrR family transcriptional regulator [Rhodococcus sp. BP-321]MBY6423732.1 TetR/AcrR family transcriptional regulator [Rhodococcus sp. BP-324]MBY6428962.1 TetR/AcrR family transcriptional regulator [Rhodococcus sp. BP-323]MBY6433967.1 TetR/AcrR family transcriptional regulator [Rhodococcus sp. BP-322]